MRLSKMLFFFLCFRLTIRFHPVAQRDETLRTQTIRLRGGSPVDPLFEPPCRPPFVISASLNLLRRLVAKTPCWKATKEYLNQRGTKIRVFRVRFRAPFPRPFFPHFCPLLPLQALFTLPSLLPSSPPPSSPLF